MNLIKISLLFLLLVGCSKDTLTGNTSRDSFLIEDCEDGDNRTLLGGYWYIATDSSKGGASTVNILKDTGNAIVQSGAGFQSKKAFQMSYHLKSGSYNFSPFVICGFKLQPKNELFDGTAYSGISYYFKGPAHKIRVETDAVTDFCYHSLSVPASAEWKKVSVPFESLTQDSWGKQVPFDKAALKGISWQITGNNNDSSSITIDNICFEKTFENPGSSPATVIKGYGIDMKAYIYKPDGNGPFPVIIVLPGGTSASNIGVVFSHHKYFGELFSSKGFAVLVLDYSSNQRSFFDTLQISDIGNAVEYVKKQPFARTDKLFLTGFSIGGANALRVAGCRNDIAGIVCYFAPCDWSVKGGGYGIKKQPIDYCKDINCPVLILQGDSDVVTDVSQAHLLYDSLTAMGKKADLVIYKGAGHGFTYEGAPEGNCVYNKVIAEKSYSEVEHFLLVSGQQVSSER